MSYIAHFIWIYFVPLYPDQVTGNMISYMLSLFEHAWGSAASISHESIDWVEKRNLISQRCDFPECACLCAAACRGWLRSVVFTFPFVFSFPGLFLKSCAVEIIACACIFCGPHHLTTFRPLTTFFFFPLSGTAEEILPYIWSAIPLTHFKNKVKIVSQLSARSQTFGVGS